MINSCSELSFATYSAKNSQDMSGHVRTTSLLFGTAWPVVQCESLTAHGEMEIPEKVRASITF